MNYFFNDKEDKTMAEKKSIFETLLAVDVSNHVKKKEKSNIAYLDWAFVWASLLKLYPESYYEILEDPVTGFPYFQDGRTAWVKVKLTAKGNGEEKSIMELLPIMDFRNNSVPLEAVTSTMVNKAHKRAFVKAAALLGLGISIYTDESLEEEPENAAAPKSIADMKKQKTSQTSENNAPKGGVPETTKTGGVIQEATLKILTDKVNSQSDPQKTLGWIQKNFNVVRLDQLSEAQARQILATATAAAS